MHRGTKFMTHTYYLYLVPHRLHRVPTAAASITVKTDILTDIEMSNVGPQTIYL